MDDPTRAAVAWLLASDEPAVRYLTRRDLLGDPDSEAAAADAARVLEGPKASALLAGQRPDGGFGVRPYSKWAGAHWRLVSLVELAAPADEPRLEAAASTVLEWLAGDAHRRTVTVVNGLTRRCASQEGNALAVACRLGMAGDPRAELLARSLVEWQWPDGGWNCDLRASGRRSSFHESLPPAWGLHEYWLATGATWAREGAARTAELLLAHRLFRSLSGREVIDRRWLALHYPPYWHYDVLQALLVLSRLGKAGDPRAGEAVELLMRRRRADGRWQPGGCWWRPPGTRTGSGPVEVVDWGRSGPNELLTLNALRVLKAAG
ncbi:MAG TPA: hypothetical protein VGA45_07030 [Actinomycetota bacterium]